MVDIEQRNGESYAEYLLRLKDELQGELAEIDGQIYRLTCMILDNLPMCKELNGALPVFVDKKRQYEKELREVEDVISSLHIAKDEEDKDERT